MLSDTISLCQAHAVAAFHAFLPRPTPAILLNNSRRVPAQKLHFYNLVVELWLENDVGSTLLAARCRDTADTSARAQYFIFAA
jgi:hypothetical protein